MKCLKYFDVHLIYGLISTDTLNCNCINSHRSIVPQGFHITIPFDFTRGQYDIYAWLGFSFPLLVFIPAIPQYGWSLQQDNRETESRIGYTGHPGRPLGPRDLHQGPRHRGRRWLGGGWRVRLWLSVAENSLWLINTSYSDAFRFIVLFIFRQIS